MKRIAIFGSTGSIGRQTLEVVRLHPDSFRVTALTAHTNIELLQKQAEEFCPAFCGICAAKGRRFPQETKLLTGLDASLRIAQEAAYDIAVVAASGVDILPTAFAIAARGKRIALATKEVVVAAGSLFMDAVAAGGSELLPVDSEHSALFQCLLGGRREEVAKLIITASGGPFLHTPKESLSRVTPAQALGHPNWSMGAKITVDSATMFNKGFEVIEASVLFGLPLEKIQAVVHPQSLVHSLVAYRDGSILAQLAKPSMQLPIAYALSYPNRIDSGVPLPDLAQVGEMTFAPLDEEKFPGYALCRQAAMRGRAALVALNAADERAVNAFLQGKIGFLQIYEVVRCTLDDWTEKDPQTVEELVFLTEQSARKVEKVIEKLVKEGI